MESLGIFIPTFNRSEFLIRQLNYYARLNSPYSIYIGDGSDKYHSRNIRAAANSLKGKLKIFYHHWPELNAQATFAKLVMSVSEPYCAFVGDDDFLVPNSLNRCSAFLKNNPDYRTVYGLGFVFTVDQEAVHGKITSLGKHFGGKEITSEEPSKRLDTFSANYWPPWAVHRTSELKEDVARTETILDGSFQELRLAFIIVLRGKVKFLDCVYVIRQHHSARYHVVRSQSDNPLLRNLYWLTSPDWLPSFRIFHETLTEALKQISNIKNEVASEIVMQAFARYLLPVLRKGEPQNNNFSIKLKNKLKHRFPGIVEYYRKTIKHHSPFTEQARLLRKSSPYYEDFLPIFQSITGCITASKSWPKH